MTVKKNAPVTRKMRGDITFQHDLFQLKEAMMLSNMSPHKRFSPSLVEKGHTHFFHSVNDKTGAPQIYCSPIGGHFHEVTAEWEEGDDGVAVLVKAECGPALEKIRRKLRSGVTESKIEEVRFQTDDEDKPIFDKHTHDIVYMRSEDINPNSRQAQIDQDRQKISHLTRGVAPKMTELPKAPTEMVES